MRNIALPLIIAASFGLAAPAAAQTEFDDVLGGLARNLFQQEQDRNAYIDAQDANTVSGYRDYLAKYPRGKYRTNAEQALARLGATVDVPVTSAVQVEARLGITFAQRVAVQRELNRLGYQTYGTDGVWGRNTRTAIASWQRDTAAKVTGYLTEPQLRALVRGTVVTPPKEDTPPGTQSAAQTEVALRLTRTQRIDIQRQLTKIGYDTGLADGLWGSRTRTAISSWQKANRRAQTGYVTAAQITLIASQAGTVAPAPAPDDGDGAALEEQLLDLTAAERVDVQRRLIRLGYPTNRTDGVLNSSTRRAIAEWQADEGEPVTGYLTADQVRLIRVETGG